MYFSITRVEPIEEHKLILTFENGERRVFDLKPFLDKGVFRELRNVDLFNTAHVSFNSVAWANEADFDPEALYEGGLPLRD
jgi:hypothetical protein